jgi:hypothetical protein
LRCGQFGFAGDEDIEAAEEMGSGGVAVLSDLGLAKALLQKNDEDGREMHDDGWKDELGDNEYGLLWCRVDEESRPLSS